MKRQYIYKVEGTVENHKSENGGGEQRKIASRVASKLLYTKSFYYIVLLLANKYVIFK